MAPAGSVLTVRRETQQELDRCWDVQCEGGAPSCCGWLKDRYGLSWQIMPTGLTDVLGTDSVRTARMMQAMMLMGKLDIAALLQAAG